MSTGNEDDVNVTVHADFTQFLPLEFLKFRNGVLCRKYVLNKCNIITISKYSESAYFIILILFDLMKFESCQSVILHNVWHTIFKSMIYASNNFVPKVANTLYCQKYWVAPF